MGGANYMGGKRNAMKARARDTVGRKQKAFFGRQRFDLLSKGLSASERATTLSIPFGARQAPPKIAFAHARSRQNEETDGKEGTSFIPSPTRVSTRKSSCRPRMLRTNAHTSSSEAGTSEVLDNLDLSEPLFFREAIDRILAMPDLAGLGSRLSKPLFTEPEPFAKKPSYDGHIQRKGYTNSPEQGLNRVQSLKRGRSFSFNLQQSRTQRKKPKLTDFERYTEATTSPMEDISDWDSTDEIEDSFYDSGYAEYLESDNLDTDADSWIVHQGSDNQKLATTSSTALDRSVSARPDSGRSSVEVKSPEAIPSKIRLHVRHDGGTIYGGLFNDPDPWRRIGIILGLEDADNAERIPTVKEGGSSLCAEEQHQNPVWETETNLNEGSVMDWDEERRLQGSIPVQCLDLYDEECPDDSSDQMSEPEQFHDPWRTPFPPLDQIESPEENESEDDAELKDGSDQDADCTPQNKSSEFEGPMDAIPPVPVGQDGIVIEYHNLDVLAVPELQEVNGRFMAPSIFEDINMDSDEEY